MVRQIRVKVVPPVPFPDISPIAFELGPLVVRWYGLAYLAGVALGVLYGVALLNRPSLWFDNKPPFSPGEWLDFGFWAVFAIIIGGRLGYVLFYDPLHYLADPVAIFQTWDGGMSFHGGLLGLVVALAVFGLRKKASFLSGIDLLGAVSTLGLLLGRLANFINGELYGKVTLMPWGVVFPNGGPLPRHPTQLYEAALEGLALFVVIRLVTHLGHGLRRPGLVAGIFGIGYALSRVFVEFFRLPDAHVGYLYGGWLTLGMVYSVPVLLAGVALVAYASRKPRTRGH
ncbi:MAG: prolipoprotein diacylglyceryl transferase [Alphaproteobacteria bacterium]|nr:prolipoprotein diacylglyceryl transferase [Alphaproteobacteria bacterium]